MNTTAHCDGGSPKNLGTVIIPAFNEAQVLKRTLEPLSRIADSGCVDLIVVCNGCSDGTAGVAREIPGVRVAELAEGSKAKALNHGDDLATLWPRIYLDADIQISPTAILAVLERLAIGDVYAARPVALWDSRKANAIVRSYYRARRRVAPWQRVMWGSGVYGLTEGGHGRFGRFPMILNDDAYIDAIFGAGEKVVVETEPAIVTTPSDVRSLLAILRRGQRGKRELLKHLPTGESEVEGPLGTAMLILGTVRGLRSAIDATVFLTIALLQRLRANRGDWGRDNSSRLSSG